MTVDLNSNYFELFELPVRFDIDQERLSERFRLLQQESHPDRHASASAAEKRWSMQTASVVNDAYQTLKVPLRRAVYLLSLNGMSIDEETDTRMSPQFLMEQMEWREALEAAPGKSDPAAALDDVRRELVDATRNTSAAFEQACHRADWTEAREQVRQWQFLDKLKQEVRSAEERLDA